MISICFRYLFKLGHLHNFFLAVTNNNISDFADMLKSIPGLKTLTLLIMTNKPHYSHEEYEIFDHFIGCCPQITTFEFDAGGHPYGGKKNCLFPY